MTVVAQVLLWSGVAAVLLCCLGVWWMHDVFDRLHYAGAATTVGPVLIGVSALLTGAGSASGTIQVATAGLLIVVLGPLITHVSGRAGRRLLHDDIGPKPEDP